MLMRVLVFGGLGVIIWEVINGKIMHHNAIEEKISRSGGCAFLDLLVFLLVIVATGRHGVVVLVFAAGFLVGCIINVTCLQVCPNCFCR